MKRAGPSLMLAAALLGAAATAQAASVQNGQELAQRNCGLCHALGPKGDSPNPMAPPFRDVHLRFRPAELESMFQAGLLTRHPAMPEFRFNLRELEDLVAFLESMESRSEARLDRPAGLRIR